MARMSEKMIGRLAKSSINSLIVATASLALSMLLAMSLSMPAHAEENEVAPEGFSALSQYGTEENGELEAFSADNQPEAAELLGRSEGPEFESRVTSYGGSLKWVQSYTGYPEIKFYFRLSTVSDVTFFSGTSGLNKGITYTIWDSNNDRIEYFSLSNETKHSVCLAPDYYELEITSVVSGYQYSFWASHYDYSTEYHANSSAWKPYSYNIYVDKSYESIKPINDSAHYYALYVPDNAQYFLYRSSGMSMRLYNPNGDKVCVLDKDTSSLRSEAINLSPGKYSLTIYGGTGIYWFSLSHVTPNSSSEAGESSSGDGANANSTVMYRMYNPNSGEHFYTANTNERDSLRSVGWKYEGHAWNAPKSGNPVYRMYNPNAGDHHYTMSASERDSLKRSGWKYEGIGWYSSKNKQTPLYRLYNPNAVAGSHHYTTSASERDHLKRIGWLDEKIGWYGA